jgi:hypothetical protein
MLADLRPMPAAHGVISHTIVGTGHVTDGLKTGTQRVTPEKQKPPTKPKFWGALEMGNDDRGVNTAYKTGAAAQRTSFGTSSDSFWRARTTILFLVPPGGFPVFEFASEEQTGISRFYPVSGFRTAFMVLNGIPSLSGCSL